MDFEQQIIDLFSPFSINYFTEQSALYDFQQVFIPLDLKQNTSAIYTIEFAIRFQHKRSKKIYQIIKQNLPLALTSSNNYIRAFALLIQKHEHINE